MILVEMERRRLGRYSPMAVGRCGDTLEAARRLFARRSSVILIDEPIWPAHGTLWAHLVSDASLDELHAFARAADLPARSFDSDHYDVPQERREKVIALGATPVTGKELVRRLSASGLRVSQRRKRGL